MRRAARIVEKMHETIFEMVEPGVRKNDLVAEIYRVGHPGTDEFGGDYPAIVRCSRPGSMRRPPPHVGRRPFERGRDVLRDRRVSPPIPRAAVSHGVPREPRRDPQRRAGGGRGAGGRLDKARAGNRASDVADALFDALERHGVEKESRCGYPIGLSYPPDWGERTISLRAPTTRSSSRG
jgi:ectoine hydrolase